MGQETVAGMRTQSLVVLIGASILVAPSGPRAESRNMPSIRVRIYDYADVARDTLMQAQQLAASFYSRIDVAIDWADTFSLRGRKERYRGDGRLQDFTINVLSRSMVARTTWPKDAIGTAVVAPQGGGRIAYVLYDRLRDAAAASGWPLQDLLAVVIAHELGHLLLPPGAHSSDGLMRSGWDVAELRRFRLDSLGFTPDQKDLIRGRFSEVVASR